MPGGWSKQYDALKLSETGAGFEWEIPAEDLPGVAEQLSPDSGPFHARLRFGRERGLPVARLEVSGGAVLRCQRCMQPMTLPLQIASSVVLVTADAQADEVPSGWETFLAADGRLTGAALVAEELLLALPIVPLHAAEADCAVLAAVEQAPVAPEPASREPSEDEKVTHPFAGLRSLMDRDRH